MTLSDAADTRGQFMEAARRLFAERGFYGTSIAAVAEELGLTKQALLHHFGTKERLYGEVLEEISARVMETLEASRSATRSPEDQMAEFCAQFCDYVIENKLDTQLLMRELLDNRRRADAAANWYLKPFLDDLVALARKTERWRASSSAEALAGVYQVLGAINYFAVSEPTLTRMYGQAEYARTSKAFPLEAKRLVASLLNVST